MSLGALKRLFIGDGLDEVVRAIVDVAYQRRPEKPLVQPEPDRIKKIVASQKGFSDEASTLAAIIARNLDFKSISDQFYDGKSFQSERSYSTTNQ